MSSISITEPVVARPGVPVAARSWVAVALPVLIAACVMCVAVSARVLHYDGNVTGFVKFGTLFEAFTHPPADAVLSTSGTGAGYDGQFFYVMARDPLLVHDRTVDSLAEAPQNERSPVLGSPTQAYRLLRVAYPASVFLISRAFGLTIPWSMIVVNVLVALALTAGVAYYAWRRGFSTLWALTLGLLPGVLLATRRDLGDPLATAAALGGLLAWGSGRRKLGVGLLVVAVLGREEMMAVVIGLAIEAGVRAWRRRATPGAARDVLRNAWPITVIPTAAYAAWFAYVSVRTGGSVDGPGMSLPLANFAREFQTLASQPTGMAAWEGTYMVVMLLATAAALRTLRSGVSALSVAVSLLAASLLVAPFNDIWGDARDSLPVLALLLIIGLERRDRTALGICVAAAAMTALIPFALTGPF